MTSEVLMTRKDVRRLQQMIQDLRIPVLAPLATALLGVREREVIRHGGLDSARTLEVERVLYQPEAAGNYHL